MKLISHRKFSAKVLVRLPPPPGGEVAEASFNAHFIALPKAELKAFDLRDDAQVDAFLRRVLVGWDGLIDDGNGPERALPFQPDTLELVINDLAVTRALLQAYVDTMAGVIRGN